MANKGDLLVKLKHGRNVVWSFLKNKVFIILLVVVVVCTFCWTIVIYFFCNVLKLNRTFILTGCREYLYIAVCIWYDASFTQMKRWNADEVTLRAVLEMLFMCLCPHWDGRRWDHREHHARFSVCVIKENAHLCHSFIQRYDHVIWVNAHHIA